MPAAEATNVEFVNVTLNGREVQARPGQTILEVAQDVGVDIPTLCHDPRLEPYGACRLCLVEVEGARGPMAACGTKVSEGMKIQTHTDKIIKLRKFVLELLLTNHPLDCPVCEAAGECRLQDYAYEYLVDMVPWGWRPPEVGDPGPHPNIAHFGSRCILCGRCVRICREVMSIGCWGYVNRGYESRVDTPYALPLQEVGCISCGQCVSACPVGAITTQRSPLGARAWQTEKTRTICSYCANGCELLVHTYNGRLVKVASELERGVNQGNLCVRGRFGHGYASAPDRLTKPLIRDAAGKLEETTWEEALARITSEAEGARAQGGDAFAALCGGHCTNEAAYLLHKLAQSVFSSANVDSTDLAKRRTADDALAAVLGSAAATNTRKDLVAADVILVVGSNLTESNPVLSLAVIKAIRQGKTVIVVDPRATELAQRAAFHLPVKPGTDVSILRAFLSHVVASGLEDALFLAARTEGYCQVLETLRAVDVEAEANVAGVDVAQLRAAAEAYGRAGAAAIIYGSGVTSGADVAAEVSLLADLTLLTGNLGRPGTGIYPVQYAANAQGLYDMWQRATATSAEAAGSKSAEEILDAVDAGAVRFLYVMGDDPALALADETATKASLANVPFLVVQDSFLTETAGYAHVVLPAALPTETDGTYTNGERCVQRVRATSSAQGEAREDWRIVQDLAESLGEQWGYQGAGDVTGEIAHAVPGYAGITFERLEDDCVFQPAAAEDGNGTMILFADETRDAKLTLAPVTAPPVEGTAATVSADGSLVLLTGSVREHHGTGVRSLRSQGLTSLVPEARVRINPADVQALSLGDEDRVRLSVDGIDAIELPYDATPRVPAGMVFVPGFSAEAPVTRLLPRRPVGPTRVKVEVVGR